MRGGLGDFVGVDAIGQAHALDILRDLDHAFTGVAQLLGDQVHALFKLGGFLDRRPGQGGGQPDHYGIKGQNALGEIGKRLSRIFQVVGEIADPLIDGRQRRGGVIDPFKNDLDRLA